MYCPNPKCPDALIHGVPGEYSDSTTVCPRCGEELTEEPPESNSHTIEDNALDENVEISRQSKRRPLGVSLVSILFFCVALMIGGVGFFIIVLDTSAFPPIDRFMGTLMFAGFFAIYFFASVGLWKQRNWGRFLTMFILLLLTFMRFPVGTIIGLPLLVYLGHPSMGDYFS